MSDNKKLKNYDDLPLVLDVSDIRRIMGISRASAYELVHTPGFPAFRSGRLIKVSKKAFFDWMAKGAGNVQEQQ
ncbi:helix-turn-helix domain-containing protein [Lachnospiraceae bacterium 38-14]|uniref:helix-turn-helix domain-containing protein n=1 Tax=Roseburia sp. 1XD42-69 TaxID=2320088 RepID=UPI000EA001A1|nr:helix-turn-helix domain-containing protein [Roseburia sp. 1XD42-69]RKJ61702.1 DNA-binding protein [Roseburia sp. 1XD42-69]